MRGLRRGAHVLLDTDRVHAGQALRGRRGVVRDVSHSRGTAHVCTCAATGTFHATTCPVEIALPLNDLHRATAGSPS